jgi:hypothetical protein
LNILKILFNTARANHRSLKKTSFIHLLKKIQPRYGIDFLVMQVKFSIIMVNKLNTPIIALLWSILIILEICTISR